MCGSECVLNIELFCYLSLQVARLCILPSVREIVFLELVTVCLNMDLVVFFCVDILYKACLEVRVVRIPDPDGSLCLAWTKLGKYCTKVWASVPLGMHKSYVEIVSEAF